MIVNAAVDGKAVVAHGTIVLRPLQVRWSVSLDDLVFNFHFTDDGGDMPNVISDVSGAKVVNLELSNWHNPLGISYSLPKIVKINGVDYDFSFFVQTIGDRPGANRLINYSVVASS